MWVLSTGTRTPTDSCLPLTIVVALSGNRTKNLNSGLSNAWPMKRSLTLMLAGTVWETNSLLALQLVWFVNATGTQESSCGLPAKKKCATTTRLSVVLDTTLDQEEPLLHAAWMESSKLDLLTSLIPTTLRELVLSPKWLRKWTPCFTDSTLEAGSTSWVSLNPVRPLPSEVSTLILYLTFNFSQLTTLKFTS